MRSDACLPNIIAFKKPHHGSILGDKHIIHSKIMADQELQDTQHVSGQLDGTRQADAEVEVERTPEYSTDNELADGDPCRLEESTISFDVAHAQVVGDMLEGFSNDEVAIRLFRRFPTLASKTYRSFVSYDSQTIGKVFPLFSVALTGSLELVQVVYEAFPEAIQRVDNEGTLLHHVLLHGNIFSTKLDVINFLIQSYPEAVKIENETHQYLPIHTVIRVSPERYGVISALLDEYPEAMFAEDYLGETPFSSAMLSNTNLQLLELFADKCPSDIEFLDFGSFPDSADIECLDLSPNRASLLVDVLSNCENCVIDLSSFWNCESFALVLLLGLRDNTRLQSIALNLPDTTCAREEIQFALRRLLRKHTTLKEFTITVSSTDHPGSILPGDHNKLANTVALALADRTEAPIDCVCFSNFNIDTEDGSFEKMLASNNIRVELKIDDCDMSVSAVESLKRGLSHSKSIRKLDLGVSTHIFGLDLTQMLRESKNLRSVSLSIHSADNTVGLETLLNIRELALYEVNDNAVDYTEIIPRLLSNPNLRDLRILGGQFQMSTLAPLLRQNPQLKTIEITCVDPNGEEGADEVLRLLQTENTSLELCILVFADLHSDDASGNAVQIYENQDELNYYCLLNKVGREKLRNPKATTETVVNSIGALESTEMEVKSDFDGLHPLNDEILDSLRYSILREVPHLWATSNEFTDSSLVDRSFGIWNWIEHNVVASPILLPFQSIMTSFGASRPKKRPRLT